VKAAVDAIRENPSWARQSKEWLKAALCSFRYTEDVPSRRTHLHATTREKIDE